MFEHRLGSLLRKTLGQVRSLPYPEYRSWELYYLLEPWGWHNDEYRTAMLATMMYNINRGKAKAKEIKDFMRDMPNEVLKQLQEEPALEDLPLERRREIVIAQIKKDFGIK